MHLQPGLTVSPEYWPEVDEIALVADACLAEVAWHVARQGVVYYGLDDEQAAPPRLAGSARWYRQTVERAHGTWRWDRLPQERATVRSRVIREGDDPPPARYPPPPYLWTIPVPELRRTKWVRGVEVPLNPLERAQERLIEVAVSRALQQHVARWLRENYGAP